MCDSAQVGKSINFDGLRKMGVSPQFHVIQLFYFGRGLPFISPWICDTYYLLMSCLVFIKKTLRLIIYLPILIAD